MEINFINSLGYTVVTATALVVHDFCSYLPLQAEEILFMEANVACAR